MDADGIIDLLQALDPLGELPRTGWLLRGVRPCESIADHSFAVALTAMLLVDELRAAGTPVDGERALRMALLHDAAEARTGDLPMPRKTPEVAAAFRRLEDEVVAALLPDAHAVLWRELEAGASIEARIVRAADRIQMMVKVLTYQRQGRGHLDEFWENARTFDDRGLAPASALFDALCRRAGRPRPRPPAP